MLPSHSPMRGKALFARSLLDVDRALTQVEKAHTYIAVAALFSIMLFVFVDATLRYAVNRPLNFTSDLVTLYLIAAGIFTVLSSTLRRGGHISVDLFANMLPRRLFDLVIGATLLLSAVAVGIMTIELCRASWEAWIHNEKQIGIYAWPMWLSFAIVAVSFLLFEVRLIHIGIANLVAGVTDDRRYAISILAAHDNVMEEPV
jgi:TRAP-type C4-dicarboxylate transport system permease small subunit